ncbi:MmpS family transport accessory protein [Amycolatopsis jejuensis]|uniref:MmpS family transport accessory protein n=1 Tax=Amycolatopsis jejuensis TaxID=330084 RepID=UPI00052681D0|nr:MmpS family transport accessory protein [Amycolatopsis jejuensis]
MGVPGSIRPAAARGEPSRLRPLGSVVVVVGVIAVAVTVAWYVMPKAAPGRPAPAPAAAPAVTAEPAIVQEITRTVVYELTGTDGARNLTYVAAGGDLEQRAEVPTPWSVTVQRTTHVGDHVFTSLVAQNAGEGALGCRIRVDGQVVAERSVAGEGRQLSCSA